MQDLGSSMPADEAQGDLSFKDLLKGLVDQVDSLQKDADQAIEGLVTGETTNIHDVTIKTQEAGIAFDLMMEIRNKLLDAYNKIIKMQS
ncbi:flagellar hook-basal body complex protein FliE [bacterium E08(2017)]|nr:flagellar hook-basal body complex protein FliE [bacterium E08(2017)]